MMLTIDADTQLDDVGIVESNVQQMQATRAQVVAVWGPSGSTGKTSVAINTAFELARTGSRVLLIDLDTYAASIEIQLNLVDHPAGLAATCRLAAQDRLTHDELLRLSQPIDVSGNTLYVMTGISPSSRWPEISAEKVEAVIDTAASAFDFIVLDLASDLSESVQNPASGHERNAATLAGLENANLVIAVGLADPIGIRRYVLARQEIKALNLDAEIVTVINRLRNSVIGHKAKTQISETLARFSSIDVDCFIPDEPENFDRCTLDSIPLLILKRKSAARQALTQMIKRFILGQQSPLDERLAKLG